jgi:hypothetical protein
MLVNNRRPSVPEVPDEICMAFHRGLPRARQRIVLAIQDNLACVLAIVWTPVDYFATLVNNESPVRNGVLDEVNVFKRDRSRRQPSLLPECFKAILKRICTRSQRDDACFQALEETIIAAILRIATGTFSLAYANRHPSESDVLEVFSISVHPEV